MQCPKCKSENRQEINFCEECGSRLESVCPECGASIPPGKKFCGNCGCRLEQRVVAEKIDYAQPQTYTPKHLAEKILNTRSTLEGERKLVTVMFADVAGFTALSEKLEPEEVHQIMEGCLRLLMDAIHKYEGTINQFTGDGVMALFGAPLAHEDHAQRACYAALAMQKDLSEYAEKIRKDYGREFQMRLGLNSGPVVVGSIGDDLHMDYTAIGDTINLASRVQQAATAGEVWVSQETLGLIRDYFRVEEKGEVILKGKAEPQKLYRVMAERSEVRTRFEAGLARGVTALVGRRPETEALRASFERVRMGESQVVDVVGEAGVGKSRLIYEFQKTFGQEATFLSGICLQYGKNINFLPVRDVVRGAFNIREGMDEETIKSKIQDQSGADLAPFLPFYCTLLSLKTNDSKFATLNPEGRKFGAFEAFKSLLLALSRQRPLVVFLEDVHWMDKISEELFTYFSRCLQGHAVMMLSAYRPEGAPTWAQGPHYQKLRLETLSANASIRLVLNLLGGLELEPALEGKIAERAGGNPFFIEEIVRELLERGDLVREENRYICRHPLNQIEIPSTIQGVIAARMDRLSEDLKRTTQVASVIGRDFAYRILKSVMELGEELRGHLSNLVGIELLYEKTLYPELEYIFKHSLIQNVAYESLLKQRRREIHARIAWAIEQNYSDRLEEHYEVLAYHYERSALPEKAVEYLALAAQKSNQEGAVQTTREFVQRAVDLAEASGIKLEPGLQASLYSLQARASFHMGDPETAKTGFKALLEISRTHGMPDFEKKALKGLVDVLNWGTAESIDEYLREMEEIRTWAREHDDKELESIVAMNLGMAIGAFGDPIKGLKMISEAEQLAIQTGKPKPIFAARLLRAVEERWLGRPDKTIELTEGAVELLRMGFGLSVLPAAIMIRSIALAETGRTEESMTIIGTGIDLCEKYGAINELGALYNCLGYCFGELYLPGRAWDYNLRGEEIARQLFQKSNMRNAMYAEMTAQAKVNLMENLFEQGEVDKAWELLESFQQDSRSEVYDATRHQWESRMNYLAGRILLQRNEIDRAEGLILENLEKVRRAGSRKREGSLLRLLGEVNLRHKKFGQAIACIGEAMAILQKVGNPHQLWEAQAALGRTYDQVGRLSEARESWALAAATIRGLADRLSDRQLREDFLRSRPVLEILTGV